MATRRRPIRASIAALDQICPDELSAELVATSRRGDRGQQGRQKHPRVGYGQAGTVRLRGNVWRLQYRSERDANGRRRQHSVRLGDRCEMTFEQARSAAALRMEHLAPRRVAPGSTCAWGAWCDRFADVYLPNLRGTSRHTVGSILRKHVRPAFADLQVHEIRTTRVQSWIASMRVRGASAETIRGRYNVLRRVLGRARAEGLAVELPKPGDIDLPRLEAARTVGLAGSQSRAYSNEELPRVLDASAARAPWLATLCMLCAFVGLRISEALGLRRCDLDLDAGWLRVVRQTIGKRAVAPKTASSVVERRIPPRLLAHLRIYMLASLPPDQELLFQSPRGGPRDASGVRRRHLRPMLARLGISGKSFHAFRHWLGSSGARSGVPLSTLQRAMRHSDLRATQRYIEIDTTEVDAAIARVESLYLGRSESVLSVISKRNGSDRENPNSHQRLDAPLPAIETDGHA